MGLRRKWGGRVGSTPTTVLSSTCIRSSNATHVDNDRAYSVFGIAYARSSAYGANRHLSNKRGGPA